MKDKFCNARTFRRLVIVVDRAAIQRWIGGAIHDYHSLVSHPILSLAVLLISFSAATPRLFADEQAAGTSDAITLQNAILKTIVTATVAAEVDGILAEVPIDIGTKVNPSDPVAKIRDDDARVQRSRAQLEFTLAKQRSDSEVEILVTTKSAAVAQNEYQRALEANRSVPMTYPPNEIDRLKLVYERSQLEVRRAEELREQLSVQTQLSKTQVDESESNLRKHSITAPIKGVVVSVEQHAGEWVERGTPIATIVDLDRLRIEGFVNSSNANVLAIGDRANLSVQQKDGIEQYAGKHVGRLVFVSPDINSLSNLVRVFVDVDNADGRLRPGLRTTVTIPLAPAKIEDASTTKQNATVNPEAADTNPESSGT